AFTTLSGAVFEAGQNITLDLGTGLTGQTSVVTSATEPMSNYFTLTDGTFDFETWGAGGMENLTPLWLLKYLPNMLSCHTTIIHGCEGPSNNITCGDASGTMSVGEGARWIERNAADVVIAGAAESKLNHMGLLRQSMMKRTCTADPATAADAVRPFDVDHAGFAIGEGGGLLILEDLERARSRGATICAEFVGFAAACDPAGIDLETANCGGLQYALARAIEQAGITPDDVGVAVAQGTAVPGEDDAEAAAWTDVFGAGRKLPAFTVTGAIGSCFAGSSGIQMVAAIKALQDQRIPPTVNFAVPAVESCLDLAPMARPAEAEYAVSGTFAIGGQSAACIFKRYQA
ncbi:hypothetical protein LCGC14_3085320, partial [marine sediment metagenome]